ncbi:B12-binding domain-containing radical SAM protein [Leminorella grimontii]|uniref:B12-binding domain-containing radical SAM protein n=1 Tax=Leminorella grimontii TaxID=82981 RepID=UPI0020842AC5|nr:B12-binding domain-containing radical SAM protein [Leminorella grimontii]GKX60751.1 B12-binding domain-containing radical SAM protein [Leminorella grimontii]
MKIALIYPNMGDYRTKDAMTPLSMGILAALSPGHDVAFYDERLEALPQSLPDADLVAISIETFTARRGYLLADRYRSQGKKVVMGGYHVTFMPDEAMQHADYVITGDAEGAWETLLEDIERGQPQSRYDGSRQRPLDDYRLDRSIFVGKRYAPLELIQYSRGCRFACDFCSIHAFYPDGVRTRPVEQIQAEIEALPTGRFLAFVDDNLFASRKKLESLLATLTPLKRRWGCQISIDVARDDALLDSLAQAGCGFALMGFESLNPANLRQMGKQWNHAAGDYREVIRALHARGICVYGTFIFGYDEDTPDTIRQCLAFAQENRLEIANFNLLIPTPGSALYARLEAEGRLLSPAWWTDPNYRYGDPIFTPRGMTPQALTELCFWAKTQFYSYPSIARRLLRFNGRRRWKNAFIALLANLVSHREIARKQGKRLGEKG